MAEEEKLVGIGFFLDIFSLFHWSFYELLNSRAIADIWLFDYHKKAFVSFHKYFHKYF